MIDGLKPYPAYRATAMPWLEKIPAHWKVEPGFAAYREKQQRNIGMIERRVLSLSYGRIVIKPTDKLHGLVPESFETYQIVDPGDIIIRSTDLQNDWTSLRVGLVRDGGIITSAYLCLKMIGPLIPEYGYLQLHSLDLMKVFYGMGSGLRQNLAFPDFKRMPVLVPPRDEQDSIVRFLDHANRRIERYIWAKKKLIALLNEQKQVIIHRTVTRGLDPNARLKPSGVPWFGEIPEHWEVRRLKQTSHILRGKFTYRPRNDPSLYDGPYPFIQTGAVACAEKFVTSYTQTLNDKGLAVSKLFPSGTLLMAIAANIGDVAILNFDACFPDSVIGFVPFKNTARDYMFLVLRCMKRELLREAPVNTQGNLNVERVGAMPVPFPALDEQITIVELGEKQIAPLSSAITRAEREIALIREYRTRLVANVVTGQLDVREAAARLPDESREEDVELVEKENGEEGEPSEFEDMADSSTIA